MSLQEVLANCRRRPDGYIRIWQRGLIGDTTILVGFVQHRYLPNWFERRLLRFEGGSGATSTNLKYMRCKVLQTRNVRYRKSRKYKCVRKQVSVACIYPSATVTRMMRSAFAPEHIPEIQHTPSNPCAS
jgi:hypothetical protein